MKDLHYGFADRAWQVVIGCDNTIPCWQHCWAKKTVNRLASAPNAATAAAHSGLVRVAGPETSPVLAWTGEVRINEAHLNDPLGWRKPAVIATGFHGDWGLLSEPDKDRMIAVMVLCPQHRFFPLTKHNLPGLVHYFRNGEWRDRVSDVICDRRFIPRERFFRGLPGTYASPAGIAEGIRKGWRNLENINFGISVMTQDDANAALPHMVKLSQIGAAVHVWHEPAIGPINWTGWEFLSWLVVGGESGPDAAPFELDWAMNAIYWGQLVGVPVKIKQLGANPRAPIGVAPEWAVKLNPRGENWDCWPALLRVRQMPRA